jgi:F-type H+-transporting ATPase subunit b
MSEHASMTGLIYPFINFFILVGALIYFLRTPVKSFVLDRHSNLKDELDRVHAKLGEAQKQYQEYSQRLSSMDAEVASLVQQIREEAETTKIRVITEAKRMADQIVIDSKRTGESMLTEFKDQIRADLANQVMARTEVLLKSRMTGDVREQLKKDFSKQVESVR